MNMKDMIQRMTEIQDTKKDQLNESIIECGDMPPAPMEMDRGNPVSINVSMNASGKDHVEDLLDMMKKAGLGGAEEVKPTGMPMRHDIEKFRGMIDGPEDEPKMLPKPGDKPMMAIDADDMDEGRYDGPNSSCCDAPIKNYENGMGICSDCGDNASPHEDDEVDEGVVSDMKLSPEMQEKVKNATDEELKKMAFSTGDDSLRAGDDFEMLKKARAELQGKQDEAYENEPEEDYKDTEYMTKDLAGGLNREKKAYKAAQPGDNAMAVETLYKELMSQYKSLK